MGAPKPARSRHCEWGAPPRSREGAHGALSEGAAWEGRATTPIHESGDLAGSPASNPFEEKEWSMRGNRVVDSAAVPGGAALPAAAQEQKKLDPVV